MKRIHLFIIYILTSLILSSCSFIVREEKTDVYKDLKIQYHQYLENDFMFLDDFQSFVNTVSTETAKSVVKIKIDLVNQQNQIMSTRFGSGVVIEETDISYKILTANDLLSITEPNTIRLQITDYMGNLYTGIFEHRDPDLELGIISIYKNETQPLSLIQIAKYNPLLNEPIMLISYRQKIMNSMVMGFITSIIEGDPVSQMYTSIETDIYGHGGAVLNNRMELIGIQYNLEGNHTVAIHLKGISLYLDQYHFDLNLS